MFATYGPSPTHRELVTTLLISAQSIGIDHDVFSDLPWLLPICEGFFNPSWQDARPTFQLDYSTDCSLKQKQNESF
jgi:hypothetical protein